MILENRERGLHTLALLDLDPTGMGEGDQQPMTPKVAIEVLRNMAQKLEVDVEGWTLVLCSDMGTDDANVNVGTAQQISEVTGGRIHCLLIPAELHDVEDAALARW